MEIKRILLVDDEPSVLAVLKKSLENLDRQYHIEIALDGEDAWLLLEQQPFDLVVTDYKMAGLNGIQLLERIRSLQPQTRVILISAYGSDELEAQARRLEAYEYLTKPLEINTFRQTVQQALGDLAISQDGLLVLSDARYRQVDDLLAQLQKDVSASGVWLLNLAGQCIIQRGNTHDFAENEIITLLSGGISTLVEIGQVLDGAEEATNLAYREGKHYDLYGLNVGTSLLLILLIQRTAYTTPLGAVWYYARRTADRLNKIMGDSRFASSMLELDHDFEQSVEEALDQIFDLDHHDDHSPAEVAASSGDTTGNAPEQLPASPGSPPADTNGLLNFEQAIEANILPPKFAERLMNTPKGESDAA